MSKQKTLFACGVTSRFKLPSGKEVEVKGKDVASVAETSKVGSRAHRCQHCDFVTVHGLALSVHLSMKHPEKRSKNSPDQQTLQPLTVEVTKAPSNPGAVGDLSKQVSAEVPVLSKRYAPKESRITHFPMLMSVRTSWIGPMTRRQMRRMTMTVMMM